MPTVVTVSGFVLAVHWPKFLTTSAMRLELAVRLILSLLQILISSVCHAQRTGAMRHVLDLHNFFRRQAARQLDVANMNKLSWNDQLATRAEETVRCSSWREHRRSKLGSNASVGKIRASRSHTLARLIGSWFSQQDYFNNTEEFQGCSPWYNCLQYRAMINARHQSVGCSLLPNCGGRRHYIVLLCFYEGGSPNEATFDFTYGTSCSKCESPLPFCEDGLCASCGHDDRNKCECMKTCNKEGVGQGRLNATSCTCDCDYGMGANCDEPCRNPRNLDIDVCALIASLQSNPLYEDSVIPIDCEQYGRQCPEQCSCRPWPGTENASEVDDYFNADIEYYEDIGSFVDFDAESFSSGDDSPVVFLKK